MRNLIDNKKILLLIALVWGLSGCTATKLTDEWRAESFDPKDFDDVLIISLTSNKTNRMMFENSFADVYAHKGIEAEVSYKILGTEFPTKEQVEAHLNDGELKPKYVLVTKFGGVNQKKDYVAPSATVVSTGYWGPSYYYGGPYYGNYRDNWNGSSAILTREGYTDVHTDVLLVTSIYRVADEELVWVGKTTTANSEAVSDVASRLAQKLATVLH